MPLFLAPRPVPSAPTPSTHRPQHVAAVRIGANDQVAHRIHHVRPRGAQGRLRAALAGGRHEGGGPEAAARNAQCRRRRARAGRIPQPLPTAARGGSPPPPPGTRHRERAADHRRGPPFCTARDDGPLLPPPARLARLWPARDAGEWWSMERVGGRRGRVTNAHAEGPPCRRPRSPLQVVMLGLDAAGKTTILYKLHIGVWREEGRGTAERRPCRRSRAQQSRFPRRGAQHGAHHR